MRHVDVTDPGGDARPLDALARSPDFIRGTADVSNGTITFTVRFATSDGMDVTGPLSLLGNNDGRLDFRMIAFAHLAGLPTSGGLDWMPDSSLPGARIQ